MSDTPTPAPGAIMRSTPGDTRFTVTLPLAAARNRSAGGA